MIVWLNAEQVAERLSISKRTALTLMYQMPHSVIGGNTRKRIRVAEETLDTWMVRQSNKTPVSIRTGSRRKLQRR